MSDPVYLLPRSASSRRRRTAARALAAFVIIARVREPTAFADGALDSSGAVSAQPAGAPDNRAEAQRRFEEGRRLVAERAWEAALGEFLESRRLYPTWSATSNAAGCLKKLSRSGEALNMLETLLNEFSGSLPEAVKSAAQRAVIDLRKVTGSIVIDGAEQGASISIDGRARGEYPSPQPLHVTAGSHIVRVYKQGFEAFEASVEVSVGGLTRLTAAQERLVRSGRLRVSEQRGRTLDVIVDGFDVGQTPWEGPIAAGDHTIMLRGDESLGTLPSPFSIALDQRVELSLAAEDLGASIVVRPVPGSASVAVDGLFVGRGVWEGRLRPGDHPIEVVADGYFKEVRRVSLQRGGSESIDIELRRDPSSPYWKRPGRLIQELGGAAVLAPGVGGEIVSKCGDTCAATPGVGVFGAARIGYELRDGLEFGGVVGYMSFAQKISDREALLNVVGPVPTNAGTVDDTLRVRGFIAGAFSGIRFGERFPLTLRVSAGAAVGAFVDTRTGVFRVGDPTVSTDYTVGPVIESPSMTWFYLEPEARVGLRLNEHFELSAGIGLMMLVTGSPPVWDKEHAINADADGYGVFDADILSNSIIFSITPGVSIRHSF